MDRNDREEYRRNGAIGLTGFRFELNGLIRSCILAQSRKVIRIRTIGDAIGVCRTTPHFSEGFEMSRLLYSATCMMFLFFPVVTQAGLVLTNAVGDGQTVTAGGANASVSKQATILAFPASSTISISSGSNQATSTYAYSQVGGLTNFTWDNSVSEDGHANSFGSQDVAITFSITGDNQNFTWDSANSVLSARGSPDYSAQLFDNTINQIVFRDTGVAGLLISQTQNSQQFNFCSDLHNNLHDFSPTHGNIARRAYLYSDKPQ